MLIPMILIFVLFTILFINRIQSYWSRQGVCEIKPQFFIGNVLDIVTYKTSWGQLLLQFYNYFKSKSVKYGGIYFFIKPTFVPLDPQIIKNILVKDFSSFANRGLYFNEEFEPISGNLFTLEDEKWKFVRTVLSPVFTPNQIKKIFQSFIANTNELNNILWQYVDKERSLDVEDIVGRFTIDITVKCLFGIDSNSINNPQCKFLELGKKITQLTWQKSVTLVLAQILPKKVCGMMGLRFTETEVEEFFLDIVKQTIDHRKKNNIFREDFINMMLQRSVEHTENNNLPYEKDNYSYDLTLNDIAAQCFVTFIGGYSTTATALRFALYELSINQDVQNLLRKDIEITLKKHNDKLDYETLLEMRYLDAVVLETLRKYPVFPVLLRNCNQKYRVPGTNVTLVKGTLINIPVLGLHMDSEYHPNPERFNPERFLKQNKKLIKDLTYLPFGVGPRMCIGYKFGSLLVKVGIIAFIRKYKLCLSEKTKTPVDFSPNSFFVSTKDKIWITVNKIVDK